MEYDDRHLRVDGITSKNRKEFPSKLSVFVGNLNFEVDEEELWSFFSDCGEVQGSVLFFD